MAAEPEFPVTFKLEKYFDKHKGARYMLSGSDGEALTLKEILDLADPECLDMWHNMKLSYTVNGGHPLVLEEAAAVHGVTKKDVLEIVPQEGIFLAMQCLVRYLTKRHGLDKLHAVATSPAYQSLHENLKLLDCDLGLWQVSYTDQGWRFDIDHLRAALKENTKLLVANFPHNPTGALPSAEEWQQILDICRERGIFLFSDEMYRLSNLDDTPPLVSACQVYVDSISLFGVSKTLGLPGARIGWVCTKNAEVLRMMQNFKDYTTICGPIPSEVLAVIALRNKEKIAKQIGNICKKNLKISEGFFNEFPDLFQWKPPKACTTGFLRIKGWLLKLGSGGATGFAEVLVKETGVLLLPSTIYNYEPDEYVRFGFGRVVVPEALNLLREFINSKKSQYT